MFKLWTYTDHNDSDKILFECDGSLGIIAADKLYKEATGKDIVKQHHIGASRKQVSKLEWEKNFLSRMAPIGSRVWLIHSGYPNSLVTITREPSYTEGMGWYIGYDADARASYSGIKIDYLAIEKK